jgi:hypothetical protein
VGLDPDVWIVWILWSAGRAAGACHDTLQERAGLEYVARRRGAFVIHFVALRGGIPQL